MDKVTCSVCGEKIGKSGLAMHHKMHRRQFRSAFGRMAHTFQEIEEKLTEEHFDL